MRILPVVALGAVVLGAVVLGAVGVSCGGEPPRDAPMRLVLDTESIESGCVSNSCTDYPMSCGATVSVRITDPDTGELLTNRETGEALALCLPLEPSETLCSFADIMSQLKIPGMPATTVRVEVALWNPEVAECPDTTRFELFDVFGRPKVNYQPQPAFAGATYFRAGESDEVTIALSCTNPDKLDVETCAANIPIEITAIVTDIGSVLPLNTEQAPIATVATGKARIALDELGKSFAVLDAGDTADLPLNNEGATPVYQATMKSPFDTLACTVTLEDAAQATAAATCETVDPSEDVELGGLLVRKEIVDAVLAALGESFPSDGLVIGRVVNESFQPTAGVSVTVPQGTVQYLSSDLLTLSGGLTTSSGYFISKDVPFGSIWSAFHSDGRRHSEAPIGGLIRGKVSAVLIRMTGDVIQPGFR